VELNAGAGPAIGFGGGGAPPPLCQKFGTPWAEILNNA